MTAKKTSIDDMITPGFIARHMPKEKPRLCPDVLTTETGIYCNNPRTAGANCEYMKNYKSCPYYRQR